MSKNERFFDIFHVGESDIHHSGDIYAVDAESAVSDFLGEPVRKVRSSGDFSDVVARGYIAVDAESTDNSQNWIFEHDWFDRIGG